jgi:Pentapeptide repeats (8 copies)
MADEIDLEALKAGEKDLVNADFRDANLDGINLSHRDFSGAKFEKAKMRGTNLRRSILTRATFTRTDLSNSNLDGCTIPSTGFVQTNLTEAILVNANLNKAIFHSSILAGADLRGADFSNARLENDNDLTGAIADESTRFDGAHILRPMIKNPVFRYYRLERGRLIRKEEGILEEPEFAALRPVEQSEVREMVSNARQAIAAIVAEQTVAPQKGMLGHNNPPPEAAMSIEELGELDSALSMLSVEVESPAPDQSRVRAARTTTARFGQKIVDWASKYGAIYFEAFAKEAGTQTAKPHNIIALYLMVSGLLSQILMAIAAHFS